MYFCLSPVARQSSTVTVFRCVPLQQARNSLGVDLSRTLVIEKSWTSTRSPDRAPPVLTAVPTAWVAPSPKERTSIHFLCLSSVDSPSIPSTCTKQSNGISQSSLVERPSFQNPAFGHLAGPPA